MTYEDTYLDRLDIAPLRLQIIHAAKNNLYWIIIAACNVGLPVPVPEPMYPLLLSEIHRMRSTYIPAGVQDRRPIPLTPPRFQPGPEMPGDQTESFIDNQEQIEGL